MELRINEENDKMISRTKPMESYRAPRAERIVLAVRPSLLRQFSTEGSFEGINLDEETDSTL